VSGAIRIAALVFVAALLQTSVFASVDVLGGTPDVLLVTLISIALLRGSTAGAAAGFAGGLIVDVATLGTLGVTRCC
jgi:rod shape-determining protein MreD